MLGGERSRQHVERLLSEELAHRPRPHKAARLNALATHPRQTVAWAPGADPADETSTNWVAFSSNEGLRQAWAFERTMLDAIQHDLAHGTWFGHLDAPPADPEAMRDYYRKEEASHEVIVQDLERLARQRGVHLHRSLPTLLKKPEQIAVGRVEVVSPTLILWHRPDGKTLRINSAPHVASHHWHDRAAFRDWRTGVVARPWAKFSVPSLYGVPGAATSPLHAQPRRPR